MKYSDEAQHGKMKTMENNEPAAKLVLLCGDQQISFTESCKSVDWNVARLPSERPALTGFVVHNFMDQSCEQVRNAWTRRDCNGPWKYTKKCNSVHGWVNTKFSFLWQYLVDWSAVSRICVEILLVIRGRTAMHQTIFCTNQILGGIMPHKEIKI